jgi:CRP-like cAMP-binding protein
MINTRNMFEGERVQESFSAGEFVFRKGEMGEAAYVLLDGEVELYAGNTLITTFESGDIFGEMALIEKCERSADARAKSDCRLAVLDQKRFLFLVQQTPRFALHMMSLFSDRLRKATERIVSQSV